MKSWPSRALICCLFAAFWGISPVMAWGQPLTAGVVTADVPGTDAALSTALADELRAAGYETVELSGEALCDPAQLRPEKVDVLVLPNAARLPLDSVATIDAYLKGGGDIIALNAPLWQERLIQVDGVWTTPETFRRDHAQNLPDHVVFDFAEGSVAGWARGAMRPEIKTVVETVAEGPAPGQRALHVAIPALDGWDTTGPESMPGAFPEGNTLTVFSAKGGPNTTQLSVEWIEQDGSRWIGVVPLTSEWQQYVLTPEDFKFWESVPARSGGTFFPANAARMTVGLSFTHTGQTGGQQEFWVGPFGTAAEAPSIANVAHPAPSPLLDTLAPSYKFFDATEVSQIVSAPGQILESTVQYAVPAALRSPQPRPQGGGFDKGRAYRWIPLLEARTAAGAWRGTPATLLCHVDGSWKGGVWASFGIEDGGWYLTRGVLDLVGAAARRMADGVFLVDGGSNFYTYFDGQAMVLGVRVVNLGKTRQGGLTARITVLGREGGQIEYQTGDFPLDLEPGQVVSVSETWRPAAWPRNGLVVRAEVMRDGVVIDRVSDEAYVWRPKEEKHFVTVENGDFMLDGARWRPHGVNYMPSSGIGLENGPDFEYWVGAGGYDPVVIQRDLEHVKDLGFNAVSIFIYRTSLEAQNLLDLLRRLDALGLKANLSLRPGTPLDFQWQEMRELIEYYRLWEQDTVFALDLAWEPMFTAAARLPWDAAWEQWIIERYGSLDEAEADWQYPVPRDASGRVVNVTAQQIAVDGDWNRMVAAYRRFLDTLLYEKYSAARRLVKEIDPNHAVSFRMTCAGDPTFRPIDCMAYDFAYLGGAVDLFEPEAYGRIGDWDRVKPGRFTYEYARWANPALPMIWAEAGLHAWDMSRMKATPDQLDAQAAFYGRMYRMFIESAADGIFFWWYPGGYRTGENSDYGVINCDGSDRPVSKVIRDHAALFINGPEAQSVTTWLEFDRDRHADGLAGVYDEIKDAFWNAVDAGQTPGLRTAGTGTDSANCPLLAVGDVPCDGSNPPKYLDGFFDLVEVQDAAGRWVTVPNQGEVAVNGRKMVVARVTLTNLGEATWRGGMPDVPGVVSLAVRGPMALAVPLPKSVGRFQSIQILTDITVDPIDAPVDIALRLEASERTTFGPKFVLRLVP